MCVHYKPVCLCVFGMNGIRVRAAAETYPGFGSLASCFGHMKALTSIELLTERVSEKEFGASE